MVYPIFNSKYNPKNYPVTQFGNLAFDLSNQNSISYRTIGSIGILEKLLENHGACTETAFYDVWVSRALAATDWPDVDRVALYIAVTNLINHQSINACFGENVSILFRAELVNNPNMPQSINGLKQGDDFCIYSLTYLTLPNSYPK